VNAWSQNGHANGSAHTNGDSNGSGRLNGSTPSLRKQTKGR
jgi:hypothetical protein